MLVRRVLHVAAGARGLKAAMVTKMLHRKRLLFVPILDSNVAAFYGVTTSRPWRLWPALQAYVRSATDLLDDLRARVTIPDGRQLSRFQTADIVSGTTRSPAAEADHTARGSPLASEPTPSMSPLNQGCTFVGLFEESQ